MLQDDGAGFAVDASGLDDLPVGALRHPVRDGVIHRRHQPVHRRHVDDRSPPRSRHRRYGVFAGQHCRAQVQVHGPIPCRLFEIGQTASGAPVHAPSAKAEVVDQHVQTAIPLDRRCDHSAAVIVAGGVANEHGRLGANFGVDRLEGVLIVGFAYASHDHARLHAPSRARQTTDARPAIAS